MVMVMVMFGVDYVHILKKYILLKSDLILFKSGDVICESI